MQRDNRLSRYPAFSVWRFNYYKVPVSESWVCYYQCSEGLRKEVWNLEQDLFTGRALQKLVYMNDVLIGGWSRNRDGWHSAVPGTGISYHDNGDIKDDTQAASVITSKHGLVKSRSFDLSDLPQRYGNIAFETRYNTDQTIIAYSLIRRMYGY